ncbi:methyltransferase family protein [Pseudothermotoga thermarum]|uniref:Isoprenylcysteine carboxyl methyltransferase n=1 Tax=Pseudothermotoga thermarum DSM 5069 TaxID=688269 RepID=F7YWT6_9THEM|nr:isoprenylcysteine carboxylmethyltransferase family protein [Pseudothermotoga thermarum]AEH50329.1 Isoprenylcysteine carboxyl methyltransferase [Pseudothermotoga thermarum DSM 5069]
MRKDYVLKRLGQSAVQTGFFAVLLFFSAGSLTWRWAWIYLGTCAIMAMSTVFILPEDSLKERNKYKTTIKKWDKLIMFLNFFTILSAFVVAGLDYRFQWSPRLNLWIRVTAWFLMFFGNFLTTWAIVSNPFFVPGVRIQSERGHYPVTNGPYRYIRHPGYAGSIIFNLATFIMLGSLWALIPGAIMIMLLIVRTALEDITLQKELDGYKQYAEKVKYRLIPGIW